MAKNESYAGVGVLLVSVIMLYMLSNHFNKQVAAAMKPKTPKPLVYDPPAVYDVYGTLLVEGRVAGLEIGKDPDAMLRDFVGHDQPQYTEMRFEDQHDVRFCGNVLATLPFHLGTTVHLILEKSRRSDYDGCYSGWTDISKMKQ